MHSRLYLDTSVISLLDDDRSPERRDLTREFWARTSETELSISDVTIHEINGTLDPSRRSEMLARVARLSVLSVTPEANLLARRYLDAKIFPQSVPDDALHVAIAVLAARHAIVSWNFKHLVNQRRRAAIDSLNRSLGLPAIAIISPPEV
jgi:predicted nucleic acid-binding protein